jgi:hypothetical protein
MKQKLGISVKPIVVETLWHNCNNCKIHYMSESPHVRAYLCDECWFSIPHMRVKIKKQQKVSVGPTYDWWPEDVNLLGVLLYILGCSLCLLIIGYYLWFK